MKITIPFPCEDDGLRIDKMIWVFLYALVSVGAAFGSPHV